MKNILNLLVSLISFNKSRKTFEVGLFNELPAQGDLRQISESKDIPKLESRS